MGNAHGHSLVNVSASRQTLTSVCFQSISLILFTNAHIDIYIIRHGSSTVDGRCALHLWLHSRRYVHPSPTPLRRTRTHTFLPFFLSPVIANNPCPVKVSMRIVEQDKIKLIDGLKSWNASVKSRDALSSSSGSSDDDPDPDSSEEDWWTFDRPISYVLYVP